MAAGGRAAGQGHEAGHAAAARATPTSPASLKYGHDDVRNALERASARHTAVHVAAGAVAKSLLARARRRASRHVVSVGGETDDERQRARSTRRAPTATRSAASSRCARRGVPPGLGSYATKEDRLDARLAAALMGIQAVKGVEIGDGLRLAGRRGSEAHDEIVPGLPPRRRTTPAGIEARRSRTARTSSSAPR